MGNEVICIRYVDDILMASCIYCQTCLLGALRAWSPVTFDCACSGRRVNWLDIDIAMPKSLPGQLMLNYCPRNIQTPPASDSKPTVLRAYMMGRCTRMQELGLLLTQCVDQCIHMYTRLCECQWERRHFRWAAYTMVSKAHLPAFAAIRALLRTVVRGRPQC